LLVDFLLLSVLKYMALLNVFSCFMENEKFVFVVALLLTMNQDLRL